jgi:hypothetical protein
LAASLPTPRSWASSTVGGNRLSCVTTSRMFYTLSLDRAATGRPGRGSDFLKTRDNRKIFERLSHHRTRFFLGGGVYNSVAIFPDFKQILNTVGCLLLVATSDTRHKTHVYFDGDETIADATETSTFYRPEPYSILSICLHGAQK